MATRLGILLLFVVGASAATPFQLLEAKVRDGGKVRALTAAELATHQLVPTQTYLDALWYASNQEFARKQAAVKKPRVVVFGGRGVFPPSMKAAVRRLQEARIPCRVVFADTFTWPRGAVVVIPGGWAPSIIADLGSENLSLLSDPKQRVLGICAGAYLLSSRVVWEGRSYGYPVGRMDAVATGPLNDIAVWPKGAAVTLDKGEQVVYAGGSAFETKDGKVLRRYPDGRAAIVAGKNCVLTAVHCEMHAERDQDLLRDAAWPAAGDGKLFVELVKSLLR
ncbi:MAG: hypothetical protein AAGD14_07480 [Planctomycetota bacterium]